MSAAENLKRWREASEIKGGDDGAFVSSVLRHAAMPALLAFAEAALAAHTPLADSCSAMYPRPICGGCYNEDWPCSVVRLAEQHLGGAR